MSAKQDKGYFAEQPWETEILNREGEKGDPHFPTNKSYRIYNITNPQGPFNDSRTSYRFKSIGGYSAAKLRRYQDIIDAHITQETNPMIQSIRTMDGQKYFLPLSDTTDYPVLNMLNMRYAVVGNEQPMVVENPNAFGNAWFVDSVKITNTPNEESEALNQINLRNTLVTDVQFKDFQAQTLLNIIQNRTSNGLKTIIVSPKIEHLIGQGRFYSRLQGIFSKMKLFLAR